MTPQQMRIGQRYSYICICVCICICIFRLRCRMSLPIVSEEDPTYYQWQEFSANYAHRKRIPTEGRVTPVVKPTVSHENVKDELEFHPIAATCPVCSCVTTECGGLYTRTSAVEEGRRVWVCRRRIYVHEQSACFADPA